MQKMQLHREDSRRRNSLLAGGWWWWSPSGPGISICWCCATLCSAPCECEGDSSSLAASLHPPHHTQSSHTWQHTEETQQTLGRYNTQQSFIAITSSPDTALQLCCNETPAGVCVLLCVPSSSSCVRCGCGDALPLAGRGPAPRQAQHPRPPIGPQHPIPPSIRHLLLVSILPPQGHKIFCNL